jgi:hypothetical protein
MATIFEVSTDFDTFPTNTVGASAGEFVTFANSIFDGVDEFHEADWEEGWPWRVAFTDKESHSGSLSITGSGTSGNPSLQAPYAGVVDTFSETVTFWHHHTDTTNAESSGYFYSMRGGPIGSTRSDNWSDALDIIYWGPSDHYVISLRTDAGGWETHDVHGVPQGWVRIEASYDHPSRTYSVKMTDGGSAVYADVSGYLSNLRYGGVAGGYGFAHHNFMFNGRNTAINGRIYLDDVNYDPPPLQISGQEGGSRRRFT